MYWVCGSLDARIDNFYALIKTPQSLQKSRSRSTCNFVQTFDTVYDCMGYYLDLFRYHNGPDMHYSLMNPNITIDLRYLDLNFPNLPASFTSGISSFDILKQSAILATVRYSPGCVEKKTKYDAEIEQRGAVESAVLAA